jgi:hypothetical protein
MPDAYRDESKFSMDVLRFFQAKIANAGATNIQVAEKIKILKDFTVGKDRDGHWRLIAGFQQQDIVFYVSADNLPMKDFMSPVMRIDKYDRTGETPVIIPLAICELKLGSSLITHTLITYASISTQLKSIFPHCAYMFLMDTNLRRGVQPETILRHCKGFDRVFLDWNSEKEKIWQTIQAHFLYLKERGILQ